VCDLGGNTAIVRQQLELDASARENEMCVVPDCGEAPGLANNLVAYALGRVGEPVDAFLYDGGLPTDPVPPWNYALTFSIDGLINEYDGATTYVIDGRQVEVPCFEPTEHETIEFAGFGTLEAFVANTASTMPWTLGERLRTFKAKVLRYPGHAARFAAFRDAGLFSVEPVEVGGMVVAPRAVLNPMLDARIRATPGTKDVVLNRVVVVGAAGDRAEVDLVVRFDDWTGFTAMEQATGFHAAIVCHLMASGAVEPGARPVEVAVDPEVMMAEARQRGFQVVERLL
jgi:lysine 6-dehydrogenase